MQEAYNCPPRYTDRLSMALPDELKKCRQFVLWKSVPDQNHKKPRKIPFYANGVPRNGTQGDATDRDNMVTFSEAVTVFDNGGYTGIGIAMLAGCGLVGIDGDDCYNGTLKPKIAELIKDTYAEISPSGTGVRAFYLGHYDDCKSLDAGIEVFCEKGFLTLTGDQLNYNGIVEMPDNVRRRLDNIFNETKPGVSRSKKLEDSLKSDPIYARLNDLGLIKKDFGSGKIGIVCPFEDDHTTGNGDGDCAYFLPHTNGYKHGYFHCLHAHCANRTRDEYLKAIGFEQGTTTDKTTPPPVDIFGDLSVCGDPEWPENACPKVIDEFSRDAAERIGVTVQMVAFPAIVVAAASITDDYKLQPKQFDTEWLESARLWVFIIGDPSTKKTPSIDAAMRPMKKLEGKWFKEDSILLECYEDALDGYKKSRKKTDKPAKPRLRRKSVNDFTIESLVDVLKDNSEGILCFRDELAGWIASHGAYKQNSGGDRAAFLESYNGGPRVIDRVKKGRDYVENWSLSILGGIQPGPARRTLAKIPDDGLVPRFIPVFGRREGGGVDRRPNYQAIGAYENLVVRLNAIRPHKADDPMRLSNDAQEQRAVVQSIVNNLLVLPDTTDGFKQHLNKWDGLFSRLALTYHIIEHANLDVIPIEVSGATASQVARLMLDFLLPNAARFYVEVLGADDQLVDARWIAGYILSHRLKRITLRDVYRNYGRLRNDHQGIFKTLQTLQTAGWVSPIDATTKPYPQKWVVDSRVHELFSERAAAERERREQEKANIRRAVRNLSLKKGGDQ